MNQGMKRLMRIACVLVSGCLLCANIYFWVDDQGIKHFSNTDRPGNQAIEELRETSEAFEKFTSGNVVGHAFKVLKVFDGDSFQVSALGFVVNIRMAGIDAPELAYEDRPGQPMAPEAKALLEKYVLNHKVILKNYGIDGYQRQLSEVFLDGKNINLEMVQQGLAEVYKGRLPKDFNPEPYFKAQKQAIIEKKGVWKLGKSYKSPRQWRREHPRK